jgi:hypothetical protein
VIRYVLAVALVVLALFGVPSSGPNLIPVEEPLAKMRERVVPVVRAVQPMSITDRLWLQTIFLNTAKVIEADGLVSPSVIETTDTLRRLHRSVLTFVWRGMAGNEAGKYAGLQSAIDSAIDDATGGTAKPVTPELRRELVDTYRAIAWAGLGKDG